MSTKPDRERNRKENSILLLCQTHCVSATQWGYLCETSLDSSEHHIQGILSSMNYCPFIFRVENFVVQGYTLLWLSILVFKVSFGVYIALMPLRRWHEPTLSCCFSESPTTSYAMLLVRTSSSTTPYLQHLVGANFDGCVGEWHVKRRGNFSGGCRWVTFDLNCELLSP